jgi:hypothetical protein
MPIPSNPRRNPTSNHLSELTLHFHHPSRKLPRPPSNPSLLQPPPRGRIRNFLSHGDLERLSDRDYLQSVSVTTHHALLVHHDAVPPRCPGLRPDPSCEPRIVHFAYSSISKQIYVLVLRTSTRCAFIIRNGREPHVPRYLSLIKFDLWEVSCPLRCKPCRRPF